jgi:hypothetical protein
LDYNFMVVDEHRRSSSHFRWWTMEHFLSRILMALEKFLSNFPMDFRTLPFISIDGFWDTSFHFHQWIS